MKAPSHRPAPTHLQHGASAEDGPLDTAGVALLAQGGEAVDQEVGALRLARAALARDDDALVDVLSEHGVVGHVGQREHVRLQLAQLLVLIHLHVLRVVDGEELEGVDGYEDAASVCVDLLLQEAVPEVLQEVLLRQLGEVAQVVKVCLWPGQEAALHQAPSGRGLGCQLHVQILDGPVGVALLQQEVVAVLPRVLVVGPPRPQQYAVHGRVAGIQHPLLPARLLDLHQHVALAAIQLQAGDGVLDDVGRGAVLGGRHAAGGQLWGLALAGGQLRVDVQVVGRLPPAAGAARLVHTHPAGSLASACLPGSGRTSWSWKGGGGTVRGGGGRRGGAALTATSGQTASGPRPGSMGSPEKPERPRSLVCP